MDSGGRIDWTSISGSLKIKIVFIPHNLHRISSDWFPRPAFHSKVISRLTQRKVDRAIKLPRMCYLTKCFMWKVLSCKSHVWGSWLITSSFEVLRPMDERWFAVKMTDVMTCKDFLLPTNSLVAWILHEKLSFLESELHSLLLNEFLPWKENFPREVMISIISRFSCTLFCENHVHSRVELQRWKRVSLNLCCKTNKSRNESMEMLSLSSAFMRISHSRTSKLPTRKCIHAASVCDPEVNLMFH